MISTDWTTIFQAIAGIAVFVGVFVAWQQLQSGRSQAQETNTLAIQEQVAQAYSQAVSELGSRQIDVRIGGMHALEEIFKAGQDPNKVPTNPIIIRIRPAVFGLLTSYIRTRDAVPVELRRATGPPPPRSPSASSGLTSSRR